VKLYFGSKEGNWLHDLMVIDYSSDVTRTIRAAKARVESSGRDINLDLYALTVDPLDAEHPGMARISRYEYTVKDALADTKFTKKGKDMRFSELVAKIDEMSTVGEEALAKAEAEGDDGAKRLKKEMKRSRSKLKTELSKRFVFAAASLCFVLVGIPLGIRSQRRESSIGMAISLGIAISYYLLVMLMLSLQKNYYIHPELLIFAPVVLSLALAARFISRNR
ncbi:MAG: LptF/LptG family permease, partial [Kiritimatiellae bacterium]|nr:LptF/LptG family permease [Kiritimatiellia bacterium]